MNTYHKIQNVFKRDPETKFKTLIEGEYSLPEFRYLKDCQWIGTEKVDGMNIRVMFNGSSIELRGKTDRAQIPASLLNKLNSMFQPKIDVFRDLFLDPSSDDETEVCFYGEGYGAKIQKGGDNYSLIQEFVLFDIKVGRWWLRRMDVDDIANSLGINSVPIVQISPLDALIERVERGFNSYWGDFKAEGIVAKPLVDLASRSGSRIITKIKHKDFI